MYNNNICVVCGLNQKYKNSDTCSVKCRKSTCNCGKERLFGYRDCSRFCFENKIKQCKVCEKIYDNTYPTCSKQCYDISIEYKKCKICIRDYIGNYSVCSQECHDMSIEFKQCMICGCMYNRDSYVCSKICYDMSLKCKQCKVCGVMYDTHYPTCSKMCNYMMTKNNNDIKRSRKRDYNTMTKNNNDSSRSRKRYCNTMTKNNNKPKQCKVCGIVYYTDTPTCNKICNQMMIRKSYTMVNEMKDILKELMNSKSTVHNNKEKIQRLIIIHENLVSFDIIDSFWFNENDFIGRKWLYDIMFKIQGSPYSGAIRMANNNMELFLENLYWKDFVIFLYEKYSNL